MKVQRYDFPDFKKERMGMVQLMRGLPTWAGNAYVNFYMDSFTRQGFIDKRFERWKPRKELDSKRAGKRGILIGPGSGRLRRSIRMRPGTNYFVVYTDVPYAQLHNEGGTVTQQVTAKQRRYFWAMHYKNKRNSAAAERWKAMALAKTITMTVPKRQFMGESELMSKRVAMHVERGLEAAVRR